MPDGWYPIRNKKGEIVDKVPIDMRDPATYTYNFQILLRAAYWLHITGELLSPEQILERDIGWAEEVYDAKQMMQFFADYNKRPDDLKGG